jgi:alkanesulfonate monooxygenase SsuD/methylene tetrahydromethanopterin reductase-like flavin-dependent oxidoreductase (luciferase family)
VATVDALSGGRTVLSPIAGYRQAEFDALGVSRSERAGRLTEGVTAVERLWTEDGITVEGTYVEFEDVTITPKPVQEPRPTVWIGANEPSAVRRAARLGDAWFVPLSLSESAIRNRLGRLDSPSGDGFQGRQPAMRRVFVAESDEAARDIYAPAIRDQFDWHADDGPDLPPFDELVDEGYLVGSPETVAGGLARLHEEVGICVVMWTHRPGVPHEAVLDSIRLTGERVIPAVRDRIDAV